MTVSNQTDVVDVVLEQHEAAKKGLNDVSNATGEQRRAAFLALSGVLASHEAAEEAVIYPALRKLGAEGIQVADARTTEESAAKENVTKLKSMDADSSEFDGLFAAFTADVIEHATNEEAEVLPMLRASWSDDERADMGDAFIAAQDPATKA